MPDGHAVELIYKDGERVAVNRIVPDTVAEQGTQESNVGEEANLLPEVEVAANKPSPKGLPEELLTQNFQPEISPEPVIYNGGVLPEVEVAANKSSSTSFTGAESLAQNSQENPINGGVLPEVEVAASKPSQKGLPEELLAQNQPSINQDKNIFGA